jgi:hypothetical protein
VKYLLTIVGPESWAEGMTRSQLLEKLERHVAFGPPTGPPRCARDRAAW